MLTRQHGASETREARLQRIQDSAEAVPGLTDRVRAGSVEALIELLEQEPGVKVSSYSVTTTRRADEES